VLFDELRRDRLNSPADRPLGPPDFGQARWVSILKRAIANQERVRGSGFRVQFQSSYTLHAEP
jgi:hypothetical protein